MARSSTVVRVSATMLRSLIEFCDAHGCGVILRSNGVEFGFTSDDLADLLASCHTWTRPCYTRKGWDSRHFGFPARTHYVHDAYDPHDAMDDMLAYARSIGGAELVEAVTSDPLYQLLDDASVSDGQHYSAHQLVNGVNPLTGVVVDRKTFLASVG